MKDIPVFVAAYIDAAAPEFHDALHTIRTQIIQELNTQGVPFVERMSYGMPGMQVVAQGKMIAGYAAHRHKCGFYPHSGGIVPQIESQMADRGHTKSAIHFGPNDPIPQAIIAASIALRFAEIEQR